MNARDVHQKTFRTTMWRAGYDMEQVDRMLDRVASALTAREEGRAVADEVTPDEIVASRFDQTMLRQGYDADEVDDFLDAVVRELRDRG